MFRGGRKALLASLAVGILLGLVVGLILTWVIWPVEWYNADPMDLRPALRDDYLILIGLSYRYDGDLARARLRLSGLLRGDPLQGLVAEIERLIHEGYPPALLRPLAQLAFDLGSAEPLITDYLTSVPTPPPAPTATPPASPTSPPTLTPVPTATFPPSPSPMPTATLPASPSPSPTATPPPSPTSPPSFTPPPTATATPPPPPSPTATFTPPPPTDTPTPEETPEATPTEIVPAFRLIGVSQLCGEEGKAGRILIYVTDKWGRGVPNVRIWVKWEGGEDFFFTGLKPEKGPGYADFEMEEGETYNVTVEGGEVAEGLEARPLSEEECPGATWPRWWRLVFRKTH